MKHCIIVMEASGHMTHAGKYREQSTLLHYSSWEIWSLKKCLGYLIAFCSLLQGFQWPPSETCILLRTACSVPDDVHCWNCITCFSSSSHFSEVIIIGVRKLNAFVIILAEGLIQSSLYNWELIKYNHFFTGMAKLNFGRFAYYVQTIAVSVWDDKQTCSIQVYGQFVSVIFVNVLACEF